MYMRSLTDICGSLAARIGRSCVPADVGFFAPSIRGGINATSTGRVIVEHFTILAVSVERLQPRRFPIERAPSLAAVMSFAIAPRIQMNGPLEPTAPVRERSCIVAGFVRAFVDLESLPAKSK